jgi:hypothetical protein
MDGYQGTSNDNLAVGEHFAAAPTVIAEVTDPAPGGVGVGSGSGSGSGSGGGSAHLAPGGVPSTLAHLGPVSGGHGVPANAAPAATAAQLAPAAVATTPQLAGGYPSPAGQPMAGSGSVGGPVAADPFGPSPILAGSNGADRVRGGSRYSAGGGGTRAGGFGPRPTAFNAGGSHVSESRLSNPAGYGSGEPASAGRAARGGGWGEAAFGAPTGTGRDGDSRERRRPSYLIEQDINAIVGELPRTAPPVIGAEEDYR